jgi:hypothetical protein
VLQREVGLDVPRPELLAKPAPGKLRIESSNVKSWTPPPQTRDLR